jgi:hypothetical protein
VKLVRPAILAALWSAVTGCGDSCYRTQAEPAIKLSVQDAATGDPICDAVVDIDLGWTVRPSQLDCTYLIPIEDPAATLTLTVEKAGYEKASKTLKASYETDRCDQPVHVVTEMKLTPS